MGRSNVASAGNDARGCPGWMPWLIQRQPTMLLGLMLLAMMSAVALGASLWTERDPLDINPIDRLQSPSPEHWFGTDHLGRDIYTRTIYGTRISLIVGATVAVMSMGAGLAIALMALVSASVQNVIIALAIPEVPRVVRVVRASVLSLRELPFVEAMRAAGAGVPRILLRHIMPNTIAPLIV